MNTKRSTIALAIGAVMGLGFSGQAAASIYAGGYLDVDNLTVTISPFANATINSFTFTNNQGAALNGSGSPFQSATCTGTPSLPGVSNNCGANPGPRLSATAANAPGGTINRGDGVNNQGDFTIFGPGGNTYANSDSVIHTAQLTLDADTHIQQIAESELQGTGSATSNTTVNSITGFTFTFTVANPGDLTIAFDATPYLKAHADASPALVNSNSNIQFYFQLIQETGGTDFWRWSPDGVAGGCLGNLGCVDTDTADFDVTAQVTTPGVTHVPTHDGTAGGTPLDGTNTFSFSAGTAAGALQAGGTYSLTLFTKVETALSRIPEPSSMLLMGSGLAAFGFIARRRRRKMV